MSPQSMGEALGIRYDDAAITLERHEWIEAKVDDVSERLEHLLELLARCYAAEQSNMFL